MGENPSSFSRTGANTNAVKDISDADLKRFPVEQVSWDDCQGFLSRLNKREKESEWVYRLPTEAEWEYACRGGPIDAAASAFDFHFAKPTNDLMAEQANIVPASDGGLQRTCKVGSYRPNALGLFDMHGNVWEWCLDTLPTGPDGAPLRLGKGGRWDTPAEYCRAASRNNDPITTIHYGLGLRVSRVPFGAASR